MFPLYFLFMFVYFSLPLFAVRQMSNSAGTLKVKFMIKTFRHRPTAQRSYCCIH